MSTNQGTDSKAQALREALADLDVANQRHEDGMQGAGRLIFTAMERVVLAARAAIAAPEPPAPDFDGQIEAGWKHARPYEEHDSADKHDVFNAFQAGVVWERKRGTPQAAIGAPAEDWLPGMRRAADRAPDAGGTGTPAEPLGEPDGQ